MNRITISVYLVIPLLICSQSVHAKIWRVNNQSNYDNTISWGENYGGTPAYPVFKQINEAVANANVMDGDTLHIEGSSLVYDVATVTKRLVIIGPGYFLTENPKVANTTYDARIGYISFEEGSQNSELIGISIINNGSSSHGRVYIRVNDITVKRCKIRYGIEFGSSLIDTYILQNYFVDGSNALYTNGSSSFVPPQDIIFNNNILITKLIWSGWQILECNNNVFDGPANELNLDFNTGSFQNNILKAAGITANINDGTNNNVEYNTVSNSGVFTGTPGVVWEPAMVNLFVENGTTDGQYQLRSDATNNVVGSDDAERGPFGGAAVVNRYNLSGLAAIPVIYNVSTTGVSEPGTGLPVNVKARTNY
tara:strand:+ start:47289 stop:48386 length:1098 start_codon:yes stop_codon:yes gene_type:complete